MRSEKFATEDTSPRQCSINGCERTDLIQSAGLCRRDYQRMRAHGDPTIVLRDRNQGDTCTTPGCGKPLHTRGCCYSCYREARSSGSIKILAPRKPVATREQILERRVAFFWANVDKRRPGECWPWKRPLTKPGYGQMRWLDGPMAAHRVSYLLAHGDIPAGLDVDHACHDPKTCKLKTACPHRACCNPAHLEAVTRAENLKRSDQYRPKNSGRRGGCPPDCTCRRHFAYNPKGGSAKCQPGCTCKRHISRPNGGHRSAA